MNDLTLEELATVLGALRFYQSQGMGESQNRTDELNDVVTGGGDLVSLDTEGIDTLCIRLNSDSESPKLSPPKNWPWIR